jgi:hypothetical protein
MMILEPENLPNDLPYTRRFLIAREEVWTITLSYGRREGVINGNVTRFFYYAYSGDGRE